jgi:hypothetical protein
MEGGRGGGCLAIPARLVEGELILDGELGSVKGCSHLGNRAPAKRKRDVLKERENGILISNVWLRRSNRLRRRREDEDLDQRAENPLVQGELIIGVAESKTNTRFG